jgi:hypothetical protein
MMRAASRRSGGMRLEIATRVARPVGAEVTDRDGRWAPFYRVVGNVAKINVGGAKASPLLPAWLFRPYFPARYRDGFIAS